MNTGDEQWMRALMSPARGLEPTDAEVAGALARVAPRRRPIPNGRRALVIAIAATLLLIAGAAAATGLLPVGSVFRGEGFSRGAPRVDETVVARGRVPVAGRWRMTVFKTQGRLGCLKLELTDKAGVDGPGPPNSGYCGPMGFEAFTLGGKGDAAARGETVLFGRAPREAARVELRADGVKVAAKAHVGPPNARGRFWVIATPPKLKNARLTWLDKHGSAHRPALDVSFRFQGPPGRTEVATGTAPFSGPWRLFLYESARSTIPRQNDVYEPEGLPCIDLRLLDPPGGLRIGGGGCGDFRQAPGFFKSQMSMPPVRGKTREILLYGRAPEAADSVRVSVGGEVRAEAGTREGPASMPADFWLIAAPPAKVKNGKVYWVDRDRHRRGPGIAVFPP